MCNDKNNEVPIKSIPSDKRIKHLSKEFENEFEGKPTFFVRVPGRVNLIGEHIDYCGYPVLPMALEQDILMAVGEIDVPELQLRNINGKYEKFNYSIEKFENMDILPDANGRPFWYNYVLCGVKGALEYLNNKFAKGIQIIVDGNIPPASGLSSSSALVSASCLSFLFAQGIRMDKSEIASLCASSERYIGTQGGGMDQAIAFLGEKYCAQYISWNPLNAMSVILPEEATFVVAHSLAEANKAATNDFNRRVIECRLAAKILDHVLEENFNKEIVTLSQVQNKGLKNLEEMIQMVLKYLPKKLYTKEEICDILKISETEINELYLTPNTRHLTEFKLQQRALHVYEEAMRVEKFRNACIECAAEPAQIPNGTIGKNNGDAKQQNILKVLGNLMSESHYSLKKLYECSHENLDRLVDLSKEIDVNCRLTGAGWGGCVVALCPRSKVDDYIEKLTNDFYKRHCNVDSVKAKTYVFATRPNYGAVIYKS